MKVYAVSSQNVGYHTKKIKKNIATYLLTSCSTLSSWSGRCNIFATCFAAFSPVSASRRTTSLRSASKPGILVSNYAFNSFLMFYGLKLWELMDAEYICRIIWVNLLTWTSHFGQFIHAVYGGGKWVKGVVGEDII